MDEGHTCLQYRRGGWWGGKRGDVVATIAPRNERPARLHFFSKAERSLPRSSPPAHGAHAGASFFRFAREGCESSRLRTRDAPSWLGEVRGLRAQLYWYIPYNL